ncbi:hypothetical protein B0T17DRAFT_545937 [Bombardia bombarda]|uniref:Uncharacterized protein n=1 Tax=Bombardia bombarda TaxID=252184 RepID=A0AA39WAF2_9PEZI|nr:hypothetical protein B0T17DRAFT_545937 [Bombardia bombarda]
MASQNRRALALPNLWMCTNCGRWNWLDIDPLSTTFASRDFYDYGQLKQDKPFTVTENGQKLEMAPLKPNPKGTGLSLPNPLPYRKQDLPDPKKNRYKDDENPHVCRHCNKAWNWFTVLMQCRDKPEPSYLRTVGGLFLYSKHLAPHGWVCCDPQHSHVSEQTNQEHRDQCAVTHSRWRGTPEEFDIDHKCLGKTKDQSITHQGDHCNSCAVVNYFGEVLIFMDRRPYLKDGRPRPWDQIHPDFLENLKGPLARHVRAYKELQQKYPGTDPRTKKDLVGFEKDHPHIAKLIDDVHPQTVLERCVEFAIRVDKLYNNVIAKGTVGFEHCSGKHRGLWEREIDTKANNPGCCPRDNPFVELGFRQQWGIMMLSYPQLLPPDDPVNDEIRNAMVAQYLHFGSNIYSASEGSRREATNNSSPDPAPAGVQVSADCHSPSHYLPNMASSSSSSSRQSSSSPAPAGTGFPPGYTSPSSILPGPTSPSLSLDRQRSPVPAGADPLFELFHSSPLPLASPFPTDIFKYHDDPWVDFLMQRLAIIDQDIPMKNLPTPLAWVQNPTKANRQAKEPGKWTNRQRQLANLLTWGARKRGIDYGEVLKAQLKQAGLGKINQVDQWERLVAKVMTYFLANGSLPEFNSSTIEPSKVLGIPRSTPPPHDYPQPPSVANYGSVAPVQPLHHFPPPSQQSLPQYGGSGFPNVSISQWNQASFSSQYYSGAQQHGALPSQSFSSVSYRPQPTQ